MNQMQNPYKIAKVSINSCSNGHLRLEDNNLRSIPTIQPSSLPENKLCAGKLAFGGLEGGPAPLFR